MTLETRLLTDEEIAFVIHGLNPSFSELFNALRDIPYNAEKPQGKAIGPYDSEATATNVKTVDLPKATKALGWGITKDGRGYRLKHVKSIVNEIEGKWWIFVVRIAE